jgi:hypothetical protein
MNTDFGNYRQRCRVCGEPIRLVLVCTNGCCEQCHRQHCTPGGATSPGHNIRHYAVTDSLGNKVLVRPGTIGFFDCRSSGLWGALMADQTPAQTAAAYAGSMFGWGCPGARLEAYNADGTPVVPANRKPRRTRGQS